jgi:hypothetical protein
MKEGNLTVLYTKETCKVYATCSVAIEQQNNRALCRSRVYPAAAWQPVQASVVAYRNLLPEASSHSALIVGELLDVGFLASAGRPGFNFDHHVNLVMSTQRTRA